MFLALAGLLGGPARPCSGPTRPSSATGWTRCGPWPGGCLRSPASRAISRLSTPRSSPRSSSRPSQPLPFSRRRVFNVGGDFEWSGEPGPVDFLCPPRLWHHLGYAYLVESTGVARDLRRGRPSARRRRDARHPDPGRASAGLRATEELFFRDPPLFSITGVVSEVRPHARVNRRNAYWRMFGIDLPHPLPARWPGRGPLADWKAHVGLGVNTDFRAKWTELLRQVWLGLENFGKHLGRQPDGPLVHRVAVQGDQGHAATTAVAAGSWPGRSSCTSPCSAGST